VIVHGPHVVLPLFVDEVLEGGPRDAA